MLAKFKKKYIGDWDFYQKYLLQHQHLQNQP
jgi:hypothetical protein